MNRILESCFAGANAYDHEDQIQHEYYGNHVEKQAVEHRMLIVVVQIRNKFHALKFGNR